MGDDVQQRLPLPLRRALLGRGLVAAGALVLGPRAIRALAMGTAVDAATLVHAPGAVGAPPIVPRSEWGADESLRSGSRSFAPITKAIVHHTATLNDEPDPRARVRAIYRYHVQGSGWDDIGYNFLIDRAGQIYEGRWARDYGPGEPHSGEDRTGLGVLGAHAYGFNRGSVGVALLGTYSSAGVTASDAALGALSDLLSWKFATRGIDPHGASGYTKADGSVTSFANLCGHRELLSTACPGDALQQRLDEVRDQVADRMAASRAVSATAPASVDIAPPPGETMPTPTESSHDDDERRRDRKRRRRDRKSD